MFDLKITINVVTRIREESFYLIEILLKLVLFFSKDFFIN